MAVDALSQNPQGDIEENEFIDASRLVYDGVRDIRQAVLMNRVGILRILGECLLISSLPGKALRTLVDIARLAKRFNIRSQSRAW